MLLSFLLGSCSAFCFACFSAFMASKFFTCKPYIPVELNSMTLDAFSNT